MRRRYSDEETSGPFCARCREEIRTRYRHVPIKRPRRGRVYWTPSHNAEGVWAITSSGYHILRRERIPLAGPIPRKTYFRRDIIEPRSLHGQDYHHSCFLGQLREDATEKRRRVLEPAVPIREAA